MMSMSPEQMRKKSLAEDESMRHLRYGAVDRERTKDAHSEPLNSTAINAEVARVDRATAKEKASIGMYDPSPNNDVRFDKGF